MLFLPTIVLAILQIFLSVLLVRVYVHTKDNTQVLLLLLITISLTVWTIINPTLLIDISSAEKIPTLDLFNKFGFFLGAVSTVQIYNFSYYFPAYVEKTTYQKWLIIVLFALCFLHLQSLSLDTTPLIQKQV